MSCFTVLPSVANLKSDKSPEFILAATRLKSLKLGVGNQIPIYIKILTVPVHEIDTMCIRTSIQVFEPGICHAVFLLELRHGCSFSSHCKSDTRIHEVYEVALHSLYTTRTMTVNVHYTLSHCT